MRMRALVLAAAGRAAWPALPRRRSRRARRARASWAMSRPTAATAAPASAARCARARRAGSRCACPAAPGSNAAAAAPTRCAARPSISGATTAAAAAAATAPATSSSGSERAPKPSIRHPGIRVSDRDPRLTTQPAARSRLCASCCAMSAAGMTGGRAGQSPRVRSKSSTGVSRSRPERSKPAFQSRRWRSTHRRPFSRSRRCSASRMCACASIRRGMPLRVADDDEGRGRPHQHAGGLLGQQQHAVVRGLADQLVELGVELGHGGGIGLQPCASCRRWRRARPGPPRSRCPWPDRRRRAPARARCATARGTSPAAGSARASCGWRGGGSAARPPTGAGSARARPGPTARAGGCPRARSSG